MPKHEKFWNLIASKSGAKLSANDHKLLELMQAYLGTNKAVLDLGCGPGHITLEMAPKVKSVLGIDTSKGMIQVAKELAQDAATHKAEFSVLSMDDDSLNNKQYDIITAFNMLHYVPNPQSIIERIHQLLSPQGIFISSTACLHEGSKTLGNFMKWGGRLKLLPRATFYSFSSIEKLIEHGGFEIEEKQVLSNIQEYYLVARKNS